MLTKLTPRVNFTSFYKRKCSGAQLLFHKQYTQLEGPIFLLYSPRCVPVSSTQIYWHKTTTFYKQFLSQFPLNKMFQQKLKVEKSWYQTLVQKSYPWNLGEIDTWAQFHQHFTSIQNPFTINNYEPKNLSNGFLNFVSLRPKKLISKIMRPFSLCLKVRKSSKNNICFSGQSLATLFWNDDP